MNLHYKFVLANCYLLVYSFAVNLHHTFVLIKLLRISYYFGSLFPFYYMILTTNFWMGCHSRL